MAKQKGNMLPNYGSLLTQDELISSSLNSKTYNDYFRRLSNIALTLFDWHNLPNNIPQRFIEKILFRHGKIAFFNDINKGFLVTKCTPSGEFNIYEEPILWNCYSYIYNAIIPNNELVIIRNNRFEHPTFDTLNLFALRLAEIERTINVNINVQKTPFFIECEEEERISLQNVFKDIESNKVAIFSRKRKNSNYKSVIDSIKVLNTNAPFISDKLTMIKHDVFNEAMTFLGINNANTDKKERLITDEVLSNVEQVDMSAQSMYKTRLEACEEINKLFNLNVSVTMRKYDTKQFLNEIEGG